MREQGQEAKVRYVFDAPKTQPLGTGGDMHSPSPTLRRRHWSR